MKRLASLVIAIVLVSVASCALPSSKYDDALQVKDGNLTREFNPFVMRGIIIPDFAAATQPKDNLLKTYPAISEVGFTVICFDLPGLNADGTAIDKAEVDRIIELVDELATRRMGIIIRAINANSPTDATYRKNVAETVGKAFKNELRAAYWFEGNDASDLAAVFHQAAPEPLVLGADIALVAPGATAQAGKPALLMQTIPSKDNIETAHFLVENKPENFAALDAVLANPAESAPWTPDNSVLPEQERADGFVSLFDGKTFNGWWMIGENKDGFIVKDGAIEWKSVGGGGLYTRERYDNFILRLDWKISPNGNSGIYIRAPRANRQSMAGFECQIQGDHGKKLDYQHTGAIYSVLPPKLDATKPEGEWNSYEITCNGPNLKVVLNGQVVQDVNMDEDPVLKYRLRKGFIGLQDHACKVAYKNIRIKKL